MASRATDGSISCETRSFYPEPAVLAILQAIRRLRRPKPTLKPLHLGSASPQARPPHLGPVECCTPASCYFVYSPFDEAQPRLVALVPPSMKYLVPRAQGHIWPG